MSSESRPHSELARPVSDPAAVIAAAPMGVARVVPASLPGVPRAASPTALSPMSILRALRRRQMLALSVAILATAIAAPAAWFGVPPAKYKAHALLQVAAQAPKVIFKTVETEGN